MTLNNILERGDFLMPKESERTKLMKENFMSLHNRGLMISEIAQKYNLSDQTVYNSLQAIADANGVSRESLLQVIKTPSDKAYAREVEKVKVDVGNLIHGFEGAENQIKSLIKTIDKTLEEDL